MAKTTINMHASLANEIALNSLAKKDEISEIFLKIKEAAINGEGQISVDYSESLSVLLSHCYGYYCYKTSNNKMVITWNAGISNYKCFRQVENGENYN